MPIDAVVADAGIWGCTVARRLVVGDSYTGAGFMDATPGGRRLATPRGNTLLPLGVRPSHP